MCQQRTLHKFLDQSKLKGAMLKLTGAASVCFGPNISLYGGGDVVSDGETSRSGVLFVLLTIVGDEPVLPSCCNLHL